MNGVVSQSMHEKGLVYKLNFGVELPRMKIIAARYAKDHALAQALWKEDIREFKILAAMLQPIETFCHDYVDTLFYLRIKMLDISRPRNKNTCGHSLPLV